MKCPSCKESLGFYAKNSKKEGEGNNQINICQHCDKQFKFGYSRILVFILVLPLLILSSQISSNSFMTIVGAGISFSIAVAIALKAETMDEETQTES